MFCSLRTRAIRRFSAMSLSNNLQQRIVDVPLVRITSFEHATQALKPYGRVFRSFDATDCRLVPWPAASWRPVVDGLSGGVTEGKFELQWTADGRHFATNTGVTDGDYCFAWDDPETAVEASGDSTDAFDLATRTFAPQSIATPGQITQAHLFYEINYHACGSQLFQSLDAPVLLVLAASSTDDPDRVNPADFRCFVVPPGIGVDVDAMVWHAPPIAHPEHPQTTMRTKQARVHSKIYYDPLKEHGTLLRLDFESIAKNDPSFRA